MSPANPARGRVSIGAHGLRVASNLRLLRVQAKLSCGDVSEELRDRGVVISGAGVNDIERGDRRIGVDDLYGFAAVFNVRPGDLLVKTWEISAADQRVRTAVRQNPICSCSFLPETHVWGASCPPQVDPMAGSTPMPPPPNALVHHAMCVDPGAHHDTTDPCPMPPKAEWGVSLKDCTVGGRPIPNTDGTPNKYAARHHNVSEGATGSGPAWSVEFGMPSDGPGQ